MNDDLWMFEILLATGLKIKSVVGEVKKIARHLAGESIVTIYVKHEI